MRERYRHFGLHKAALCALVAIAFAASVRADDRTAPNVGIVLERLQSERRTVLAYLAHDNIDLALTALDRWRSALRTQRSDLFGVTRGRPGLNSILKALDAALAEAVKAIEHEDGKLAAEIIRSSTIPLDAWRREGGMTIFSDCIADLSGRYRALDRYRLEGPDLDNAAARGGVGIAAAAVATVMNRCDIEASETVRSDPEFRRLAEGMSASLAKIPTAIDARDPALLYRLLIELRAFEQLLLFRYG